MFSKKIMLVVVIAFLLGFGTRVPNTNNSFIPITTAGPGGTTNNYYYYGGNVSMMGHNHTQDLNHTSNVVHNRLFTWNLLTNIGNISSILYNLNTTIGLSALTNGEVDQLENIGATTITAGQWAYVGNMDQNVRQASSVIFDKVSTGHGSNELYAMNQDVESTDAVTFATVDTGQGANELYDMDQNVDSSAAPQWTGITLLNSAGNCIFVINADESFKAKIRLLDADDGQYWEDYIDEDSPYDRQLAYYDGSTHNNIRYYYNGAFYMGVGTTAVNYGITMGTVDTAHDKGYAHTWIDGSDPLIKESFDIPVDKLMDFYDAVNIIAYYNKDHYWTEEGDLIIGETDYSRFEIGCDALELKNSLADVFGDKIIDTFIYERDLDNQKLMGISYRSLSMALIEALRIRGDENIEHTKHIESFLQNYGYVPLEWG